ncbi:MAG: hypothetical protein KBF37_02690 [Saprospiraceae bacterium]|jgi:hypothetical protein|nr:hypothetical protein [Saprospiraceae bacterium]MBP9209206.1 hypothetical protein [Saprospiraceae bacterium]
MKKTILLFAFGMFAFAGSVAAQCSHGAKAAESKTCVKPSEAALKAASTDANIETKVCEKSGSVCFKRKTVGTDGTASYEEVRYDEATAQFVALSQEDASASGVEKKSCSSKGSGKSCCSSKGKGKSCCASKSKGNAAAPTENVAPAPSEKSE